MQARESQINERQNTTTAIKNKVTHKAYFPLLYIYLLFNNTMVIKILFFYQKVYCFFGV